VVFMYLTAVLAVSARSHRIDNVFPWSHRRFQLKQTIRKVLCSVGRASLYNSCKWPTLRTIFFSCMFIPIFTCFEHSCAHHQEN